MLYNLAENITANAGRVAVRNTGAKIPSSRQLTESIANFLTKPVSIWQYVSDVFSEENDTSHLKKADAI